MNLRLKIVRKLTKLRLQPIRVFCFHHVSDTFDDSTMYHGDWLSTDEFKQSINKLQDDGYSFISLSEAHEKLTHDLFRSHKYAVLTADDGYASLKEILPWLEKQNMPVTLFVNGKYLDGKSYRDNPMEQYLTRDELFQLTSPLIEIGSHGWEHNDAVQMTDDKFAQSIESNISLLSQHPHFIPFHAYTWGRHSATTNKTLMQMQLIPVLMDGMKNYNDQRFIHRELLQ